MSAFTEADHIYIRIMVNGEMKEHLMLLNNPQSPMYAQSILGAHIRNLKSDMEIREPIVVDFVEPEPKAAPVDVPKKPRGFQRKKK